MSYRIAFGLCLLVMGCDASGGARETVRSAEARLVMNVVEKPKNVVEKPNPSDPACGACSFYLLTQREVYASLDGVADMPQMDLVLYSSSKQILQSHFGLAPMTYAPGKAVYQVPDGATQGVSYGVLRWQSRPGDYQIKSIPAVYESLNGLQ